MSADHYGALGISRDASADDIKAAYRRAASAHHPDRGGDEVKFKAAAAAYECLGNAERRAAYDETGEDGSGESLQDKARSLVRECFDRVLSMATNEPMLDIVRSSLRGQRQELSTARAMCAQRRRHLERRSGKIVCKRGDNLVQQMIDDHLRRIEADCQQIDARARLVDAASAILEAYEEVPVEREQGRRAESLSEMAAIMSSSQAPYHHPFRGGGR